MRPPGPEEKLQPDCFCPFREPLMNGINDFQTNFAVCIETEILPFESMMVSFCLPPAVG